MSLKGEFAHFTCDEPGARASFEYPFDLPIEMMKHPLFKLKYCANNPDTECSYTCIWIVEGDRPPFFR